jgi:hypothetical protein
MIRVLQDRSSFVYTVRLPAIFLLPTDSAWQDPYNRAAPNSLFRSPLIQDIICRMWYAERQKSEGIRMQPYFEGGALRGLPLATISLVVTAVS